MNLTISLAQTNIQIGQPAINLPQACEWIQEAARAGSQIILFPELWTTGYALEQARELAKTNREVILPQLAQMADDYRIHIGGSLMLEQDGKIYNTFVLSSPGQPEPVTYSKIHLFQLMDEDKWLAPGSQMRQFRAPWGETGLAICYDLRFPEMFRHYAVEGASLFLISAEWPDKRAFHWQTLLRARAIENQCFVAATNSVGLTNGETFGGRSALISPWGETLVEGSAEQPGLLTTSINLDQVEQVRRQIPILQDRRPDLYR